MIFTFASLCPAPVPSNLFIQSTKLKSATCGEPDGLGLQVSAAYYNFPESEK